jgi:hypothetical protein
MENSRSENQKGISPAIRIGSIAYVVWGVLHIYVGYIGINQYSNNPNKGLWSALIGGDNMPVEKFQFATDPMTLKVTANFILNFCLDVAGYGLLGILLGAMLWKSTKPWLAYFIGFFIIGLADLSFLFLQVTPGHIKGDWGTYGGPILWFIAITVLPFGLPKLKWKELF